MVAVVAQLTGIAREGLILNLDASNSASYSGSGTTWTDLTGHANATIYNGGSYSINYVAAGQASYFNFGSQDTNYNPTKTYIGSSAAQLYQTMTIVFYPDFTLSTGSSLCGLMASSTGGSGTSDESIRFQSVNGTGPWVFNTSTNNNDWDYPTVPTWYKNNTVYTGTSGTISAGWNILTVAKTNSTGNFSSAFNYYLGCGGYNGDNRNFRGRIALVLGYNRVLTAFEQLQNYAALKNRFGV